MVHYRELIFALEKYALSCDNSQTIKGSKLSLVAVSCQSLIRFCCVNVSGQLKIIKKKACMVVLVVLLFVAYSRGPNKTLEIFQIFNKRVGAYLEGWLEKKVDGW